MTMRDDFIATFGIENTEAIERAADSHANDVTRRWGSDRFRWALVMCLGYQCMSKPEYREHHGITAPWDALDAWMQTPERRAWFADHDGECDYLALLAGTYNPYMPQQAEVVP